MEAAGWIEESLLNCSLDFEEGLTFSTLNFFFLIHWLKWAKDNGLA